MNVLFKVDTAYNIFVSAVLSELYYKNDYKFVLISGNSVRAKEFIHLMKKSDLFDEIIVSKEMSNDLIDIEERAKSICKRNIDVYHMFHYDDVDSIELVYQLPDTTRIVLTDEGTSTANLMRQYISVTTNPRMPVECLHYHQSKPMLWEKASEVMLFDDRLYDGSVEIPTSRIEIENILQDKERYGHFLQSINALFQYEEAPFPYEYVIFDAYFGESNCLCEDYEKHVCEQLYKMLKDYNYIVKLHPHEKETAYKYRYGTDRINVMKSKGKIPWEVCYLNMMYENPERTLYVMGYDSMALFNSIIIANKIFPNIKAFSMSKMYETYMLDDVFQSMIEDYREKFHEIYKGKYSMGEKIEDLQDWMKKGNVKTAAEGVSFDEHSHYVRRAKLTGNTSEESVLNIVTDEKKESIISYIDYSYESGKISFEADIKKGNNYTLDWKVIPSSVSQKILIQKVVFNYQEDEKFLEDVISKEEYECAKEHFKFSGEATHNYSSVTFYYTFYNRYRYHEMIEKAERGEREHLYYELLVQWMHLIHTKIDINKFLTEKGYKKIGIYGNGKIGELFLEEIDRKQHPVSYITKNGGYTENGISVHAMNQVKDEDYDLVVVTPLYVYDSIKAELGSYISDYKIVSIQEIIGELKKLEE